MSERRPRPKRGPVKVARKTSGAAVERTIHDERMEIRTSGPRFVPNVTFRPKNAVGIGVVEDLQKSVSASAAGGGGQQVQYARVERETTGFDTLQKHYDSETFPTTLPEPGTSDIPIISGYLEVSHMRWDDILDEEREILPTSRRYCEICVDDKGIQFVHKAYAVKSEVGHVVILENSAVRLVPNTAHVELKKKEDKILLRCETEAEAAMWCEALESQARLDEEDKAFEAHLDKTYGVGLDFLAEVEREDRRRMQNNLSLFGGAKGGTQIREDELFLLQLPHIMPSVAQGAAAAATTTSAGAQRRPGMGQQRPGTPPPGAAAAGGAQRRTSTPPPAAVPAAPSNEKVAGGISHKPGTGWAGRALGMNDHPPSLAAVPPGEIGKIQVHKSGRIVMKIGECCFDLISGGEATHAQTLMAIYEPMSAYKAQGFGARGCPIYNRPVLNDAAKTGEFHYDGDTVTVHNERVVGDTTMLGLPNNGGWVPVNYSTGKWVPVGKAEETGRAYELGQISRKVVASASFDYFDNEGSG